MESKPETGRGSLHEFYGVTKTLSEWAEAQGLEFTTVYSRIVRGMGVQEALEKDVQPKDQTYRRKRK